ncbi:MAG: hypothetical protein HOO86_03885 [Bacteroidales bacterium]|nr:hypothetical protein [Bacteroidales bacterium]
MKTTRTISVLLAFIIFSCLSGSNLQAKDNPAGLKASYPLNGSGNNALAGPKATILKGKVVAGYDGKPNGAYFFDFGKHYSKSLHNITIPVNVNTKMYPKLSMGCWVKAAFSMQRMFVLGNGTDSRNRCIIADYHDDQFRWGLLCGSDGVLWGPPVVDEWVFVMALYDAKAQEARLIVNDQVFASRSTAGDGEEKIFVGALIGAIDDINIFDQVLTQPEIESLSGKSITKNLDKLAIQDKYAYKDRLEKEKENKIQAGDVFVVDTKELQVKSTNDEAGNVAAILTTGDSIRVLDKLEKDWYKISFKDSMTGFVRRSAILDHAYPKGSNVLWFRVSQWLKSIFDFTKLNSWIMVAVFTIILFIIVRYYTSLDQALLRLHHKRDAYADGGSKSEPDWPRRKNFLHTIYPVEWFPPYPIFTGMILGATIFIAAFWDAHEMEWFFNDGFNLLPAGYDRPIHWFLYLSCIINVIVTLSWILESFVLGGPFVGLLRIFILLILNVMSLLVTFFLLALILIITIAIFGLRALGSMGNTRKVYYYK